MSEKIITKKIVQIIAILIFIYLLGYIIGKAFYYFKQN